MSPIVFDTADWEAVHGPMPPERPLWPASGVVRGLRLRPGMIVDERVKFERHAVVIQLPEDGWSATGEAKSMLAARRIAVDKVKAELARRAEA